MRRRTGRRLPPCRRTRCRIGPAGYGRCTATGTRAAVMCGGLCAVERARPSNQAEQSMKALTLRTPLARLNGSVVASRDPGQQKERRQAAHAGQGQDATNTVTPRHPPQPRRPLAEQLHHGKNDADDGDGEHHDLQGIRDSRRDHRRRPKAWPVARPSRSAEHQEVPRMRGRWISTISNSMTSSGTTIRTHAGHGEPHPALQDGDPGIGRAPEAAGRARMAPIRAKRSGTPVRSATM